MLPMVRNGLALWRRPPARRRHVDRQKLPGGKPHGLFPQSLPVAQRSSILAAIYTLRELVAPVSAKSRGLTPAIAARAAGAGLEHDVSSGGSVERRRSPFPAKRSWTCFTIQPKMLPPLIASSSASVNMWFSEFFCSTFCIVVSFSDRANHSAIDGMAMPQHPSCRRDGCRLGVDEIQAP